VQKRTGRRLAGAFGLVVVLSSERLALGLEAPNDSEAARPCRPTVSCTADIVAPGASELEVGAFYARLAHQDRLWAYPVLLKQTFTPLLQLQVGSNGYTVIHGSPNVRHLDNVVLGPKLHFADQGSIMPSLALTTQVSLPVSEGGHDAGLFIGHASKDFGPVHIDWNAGLDVWWGGSDGGAAAAQPFTALAASATPVPPIGVALEGYAFANARPYSPRDGGVRTAITATPRPWLVFDFGGDLGWYPSTRDFSLFLGMTLVPVVFWREPEK
jgi:hypothetical protein